MAKKKRGLKGFFRKIGGGIKKAVGVVGKIGGGAAKLVGNILPGPLGLAAKTVGNVLSPVKVNKIVDAVERTGVVQVDKIEETVIREGGTQADATRVAEVLTPEIAKFTGATVDDTKAKANVTLMSKLKGYMSKPIVWVGLGVAAYFLFFNKKRKGFR